MKKIANILGSLMLTGLVWQGAKADVPNPVVVELFTSQGCYSCPPAEKVLQNLADKEGIVALEFHVDYWDYIGWKDPFASRAYTERQQRYARIMNQRYVYTPQMVFNGHLQEVGSRYKAVEMMVHNEGMRERHVKADLDYDSANGMLSIDLKGHTVGEACDIILVTLERHHETEILRGENRGKNLINRNVVTSMQILDSWSGGDIQKRIAIDAGDNQGVAILVQEKGQGTILSADIHYF